LTIVTPHKLISELVSLLRLEPSVSCVVVEGPTDRDVVDWYFERRGKRDTFVYAVDEIEIDPAAVRALGLSPASNRDKVITLAHEFEAVSQGKGLRATCVVDADYDRLLNHSHVHPLLAYTDYTSMEMYYYREEFLRKLFTYLLPSLKLDACAVLRELTNALQLITAARLATRKLGWGVSVKAEKYIRVSNGHVMVDETALARGCTARRPNGDCATLQSEMATLRAILHTDARHNIRGHDFTAALFLYMRRTKPRLGVRDTRTFERVSRCAIERDWLEGTTLFSRLESL
jgi:hypothetical protein